MVREGEEGEREVGLWDLVKAGGRLAKERCQDPYGS